MKKFGLMSVVGLLIAGFAAAPGAQAVTLQTNNYLDVTSGGITARFTVTSCTNPTFCNGSVLLVQDQSNLGVEIKSATPGQDLVPVNNDWSFSMNVATASPALTGFTLNWNGTGIFSSAADSYQGTSTDQNVSTDFFTPTTSVSFAPVSSFANNYDFNAPAGLGSTVTSVTQDLATPEPGTITLLGVGVVAAAFVRRRRV